VGAAAAADLPRDWLIVGVARKPHGVHGDVVVEILTDFPERLQEGVCFGLGDAEKPEEYHEVFRVRIHKQQWLLSIKGVRDRTAVESWSGKYLFLPALSRDELPEGYYYEHELTGLECRSVTGELLGTATGLDQGPGQTRLMVCKDDQEYLVPWVPAIVSEVDLEAGRIIMDPPQGLFSGEEA
jgi:16S rRNA processing protein RimM